MKLIKVMSSVMMLLLVSLGFAYGSKHSEKHEDKDHKEPASSAKHSDHEGGDEKHGHKEGEEDEEEEEGAASVGPGKAITAASKQTGIQLSEKAVQTLGLKTTTIESQNIHRLSPKAVVSFQDEMGVYRLRSGWYKLIEIEISSKSAQEIVVKSAELKPGDQIVTEGVGLLRVAELEAFGGSGEGHGH